MLRGNKPYCPRHRATSCGYGYYDNSPERRSYDDAGKDIEDALVGYTSYEILELANTEPVKLITKLEEYANGL